MKKICNSVIALLLFLVLFFTMVFISVSASNAAQIEIKTLGSGNGVYKEKEVFEVDEKIYLAIKFSGINDVFVQGFACKIGFDNSVLTLSENTFTAISDENAYFYKGIENDKVVLLWDSTSPNTIFNGEVIFVVFETKQITESKDINFTIEIDEFYSSLKGKPDIPYNIVSQSIQATISNVTIGDEEIEVFKKLENITTDSLEDIVEAETVWSEFTSSQKQFLMNNYKNEYDWLSTARNRLNSLISEENELAVKKLVEEFKTTYKDVLLITDEMVKTENKSSIEKAYTAYKSLPSSVTTRLDQQIPTRLQGLLDRIETLEDAKKEADSFVETYQYLTEMSESDFENFLEMYVGYVDEAIMVYDLLSDDAKLLVKDTYEKIAALKKTAEEIIAADEAMAAIRSEINAFQQKWLRVFTLNTGNVTVYDRTAIEMTLADYEKSLGDAAKEGLASRITTLKGLLEVIKGLEDSSQNTSEDFNDTSSSVEIHVDNIQSQVESNQNIQSDSNQNNQPEIQETVVEKEIKVTNTKYLNKNISKTIWIMLILLILAVLTLLFPLIMTLNYKKRLAALNESNFEEEENI